MDTTYLNIALFYFIGVAIVAVFDKLTYEYAIETKKQPAGKKGRTICILLSWITIVSVTIMFFTSEKEVTDEQH